MKTLPPGKHMKRKRYTLVQLWTIKLSTRTFKRNDYHLYSYDKGRGRKSHLERIPKETRKSRTVFLQMCFVFQGFEKEKECCRSPKELNLMNRSKRVSVLIESSNENPITPTPPVQRHKKVETLLDKNEDELNINTN
ncbi:CLUMA_CG000503, isoform A [Clunio marinus]|uniref:CLUMA_CG000503, isoform A n=1 Tax=Clunio marinus TaxID=568069 RepID=A0A1J1HFN8_9DIPT|nr:CLUMA_CG000503, isoform A [Clunio marinus]